MIFQCFLYLKIGYGVKHGNSIVYIRCSDETLKTAKTIDLCNNPLTKEPKLQRAKRILPEWEGLDLEVQKVKDSIVGTSFKPPNEHVKEEL